MDKYRTIQQLINGQATTDGAGVNLTRLIGSPELNSAAIIRMIILRAFPPTPTVDLKPSPICSMANGSIKILAETKAI